MRREERIALMVALYRSSLTLEEIGNRFGVTRERVRQILSAVGEPRRDTRRKELHDYATVLTPLRDAGLMMKEAAHQLGVDPSTVSVAAKRHGICWGRRRAEQRLAERSRTAREAYESGMTIRGVARFMGCAVPTAYRYLRLSGVTMRSQGTRGWSDER